MLLYIHIPFCDSKCFYCSFNSYTDSFHLKTSYENAICEELTSKITKFNIKKFKTVFFGGGTPSSIKTKHYENIFKILEPFIDKDTEITFEANPNSATLMWLTEIKNLGANRISFGVQSFDDNKLRYLGRAHNSKTAILAIENARNVGFKNINCDILYNSEMDSKDLISRDLSIIKSLNIEHLSAYSLTIEEQTKFFDQKLRQIDDEDFSKFCIESIKQIGFCQYEISNFAKSIDFQSKHNLGYWQKNDYLGIGAGAVGCIGNIRTKNESNIQKYIDLRSFEEEILDKNDILIETIFLGLRSCVGIDEKTLDEKTLKNAKFLVEENKLKFENGKFFNDNFLLSDELALFILRR